MKTQNAYFIIWNSSKNNFENIINDIKKTVNVKLEKHLNITKYKKLICDIYSFNNQNQLGLYKADKMCIGDSYDIYLLEVEFLTNDLNDYSLIKKLKSDIRNKYKSLTTNYFHDNIIHGTDSFLEFVFVKDIFLNIELYLH